MNHRLVVLDTETTGLEVGKGHRIVEIGCVELIQRRKTGNHFHRYIKPQRDIDEGARAVTGLTEEFLADKPLFAAIADDFLAFIDGAELIIHNAAFDVGFLDAELERSHPGQARFSDRVSVTDTLLMARERFPGKRNALDALCSRFDIDNSHRTLHGALLDAELLAEVYLAMTAGQGDLSLAPTTVNAASGRVGQSRDIGELPPLRLLRADADESARHRQVVDSIDKACGGASLWRTWEGQRPDGKPA